MFDKRFGRFFSITLLAVMALGLSFTISGCGSDHKGDDVSRYIKEIYFYPEGATIVNNQVMDSTKSVKLETLQTVEVQKDYPVKFTIVGNDNLNRLQVLNNDKLVVGWENSADYSKYVKLGSDWRTLEYVSQGCNVMNLIASYQAVAGATPVQKPLAVTSVDGSLASTLECIEFYKGKVTVDYKDSNTVLDAEGNKVDPITDVTLLKSEPVFAFTCVAKYPTTRCILAQTSKVNVDWYNYDDKAFASFDTDVNLVVLSYIKEKIDMPLVVEYRTQPGIAVPNASGTLNVSTIDDSDE